MPVSVRFTGLAFLLLLSSTTLAVDLGEFNYTEFVENIKKTAVDHRNLALLKEGGDLRPAGQAGILALADNQTAFVMQGKQGAHNLSFTNSSLDINSVGSW